MIALAVVLGVITYVLIGAVVAGWLHANLPGIEADESWVDDPSTFLGWLFWPLAILAVAIAAIGTRLLPLRFLNPAKLRILVSNYYREKHPERYDDRGELKESRILKTRSSHD